MYCRLVHSGFSSSAIIKKAKTTIATTKLEIVVYKPKDHCILANGQRFSVLAVFSLFALVNYGPPSKYFFCVIILFLHWAAQSPRY